MNEEKPRIDSIRITYHSARDRREPKAGDIRITKKHGKQVRRQMRHDGAYVVSNGRPVWEWVGAP